MSKLYWLTKACGIFLLWAMAVGALPAQTFTSLLSFSGPNGIGPYGGVVQGVNGNLYGTTNGGGSHTHRICDDDPCGTVFEITPGGALTTLYNFCAANYCPDGWGPIGGLVLGTNGSFYGTTELGGNNCLSETMVGCGTIFKITSSGTLTTLQQLDSTNGDDPYAALIQAANGNFYGTTASGGANNDGVIFKSRQAAL
jgi:uncharacterized repeat protein (TIGR03803 family)